MQKLDLNHPNDPRMAPLLIAITEAAGLRKTASLNRPAEEGDKGNPMIDIARKVHRRLVATGEDPSGSMLTRLAILTEAEYAEKGDPNDRSTFLEAIAEDGDGDGDDKQYDIGGVRLKNVKRAWERHKRDINALREQGELIVSIWGMALLRSYTKDILTTDFSRATTRENRDALSQKVEFEAALRTLYPRMLYPKADLPHLADLPLFPEIGPRIGCLCMLSYVTLKNELQDFFIGRVDKWQKQKPDQTACRRDLVPAIQTKAPQSLISGVDVGESEVRKAEEKLQAAPETKELQEELEKKKSALQNLQEQLNKANMDAASKLERFKQKSETVTEAAKVCYVDPPAPPATPPAPPSP